jgi:adenylosuccinate lyase
LHERIRRHSLAAAAVVKQEGRENDLIARLRADEAFAAVDWAVALEPARFIGRAPEQVEEYLSEIVAPIRERYADALGDEAEVSV